MKSKKYSVLNIVRLSWICFAVIISLLNSCKGPEDPNSTPTPNPTTPGKPDNPTYTYEFKGSTEAGIIYAFPEMLVLKSGSNYPLSTKLYNSQGKPETTQPTFTYTVSDPEVAQVNSTGSVTALKEGSTSIVITDGKHGSTYVNINVVAASTTLSDAPVSVAYSQPLITAQVGSSGNITYTTLSEGGTAVNTTLQFFEANNKTGITFNSNGSFTASKEGLYTASTYTTSGKDTLIGSAMILIFNLSTTPPTCKGTNEDWKIEGVKFVNMPRRFPRPGLKSDPLYVRVFRMRYCAGVLPESDVRDQKPDRIELGNSQVLGVEGNSITSIAPGESYIKGYIGDIPTDNCFFSVVDADFSGKWSVKAYNGDVGMIDIRPWTNSIEYVKLFEASGGRTGANVPSAAGTICLVNNDWQDVVDGEASCYSYTRWKGGTPLNYCDTYKGHANKPRGSFLYKGRQRHFKDDEPVSWEYDPDTETITATAGPGGNQKVTFTKSDQATCQGSNSNASCGDCISPTPQNCSKINSLTGNTTKTWITVSGYDPEEPNDTYEPESDVNFTFRKDGTFSLSIKKESIDAQGNQTFLTTDAQGTWNIPNCGEVLNLDITQKQGNLVELGCDCLKIVLLSTEELILVPEDDEGFVFKPK